MPSPESPRGKRITLRGMHNSIRGRLVLWYTLALAFALVLLEAGLYATYSRSLVQAADMRLADAVSVVSRSILQPEHPGSTEELCEAVQVAAAGGPWGPVVTVFRTSGQPLASAPSNSPLPLLRTSGIPACSVLIRGARYRLYNRTVGGYTVEAAIPWEPMESSLVRVRRLLIAILGLFIVASGVGSWALVGTALRSIERIATAATMVSVHNPPERLPCTASDREIKHLVSVLNGMIAGMQAALQTQKRFVADASHELRTPVTIIQSEVEVALSQPRTPAEYKNVLASVLEEAQRMSRLIADLLFLARTDAAAAPLRPVAVPMVELCRVAARGFDKLAQARDVTLTTRSSLPEVLVHGDPDQLRRLVENLVTNAIRHTPKGGKVELLLSRQKGTVVLEVRDTGPGIAAEHLPHLFERFYRAEQGRGRDSGGTGLGLAICQQIARLHGGEITVESTLGKGSCFALSLPAAHADGSLLAGEPSSSRGRGDGLEA